MTHRIWLLLIVTLLCAGLGLSRSLPAAADDAPSQPATEPAAPPSDVAPADAPADDSTAPDEAPPDEEAPAPEPIISANGLELLDWYATDGHQLHIVFRDQGTVTGNRSGKIEWVATLDNGKELTGTKRFHCSPFDNYDTDLVLTSYQPKLSEQWAHVTLNFVDNKGTSSFWCDVYFY